jgi:hypothetical protein
MSPADILVILLTAISLIYYVYLVDPFKWRASMRHYTKLIANPAYYRANMGISLCLVVLGVVCLFSRNANDAGAAFAFSPLLFIFCIRFANARSLNYQHRSFRLILRGEVSKINTSAFDVIASIFVFMISLLLPLAIIILISKMK